MSLHRRAAKRDGNEAEIISALERIGVTVFKVSGAGIPDLLTFYRGQWLPLEIKMPKGKLTNEQAAAFMRAPFAIARTVDEALACFRRKR